MERSKLYLNIMGFTVQVITDEKEIYEKIKMDFSTFVSQSRKKNILNIETTKQEDLKNIIPSDLVATKQTQNSITYDTKAIRYNDFYSQAVSVFDYENENANIYYSTSKILHELIYLLILSRSGKYMDLHGLHKVHACGISKNNKNLIVMMPSKGGKTTTYLNFLKDENVNIISDDTPVINTWGEVKPFALRLGVEAIQDLVEAFPYLREEDIYEFERKYYNKKYLVQPSSLRNKVKVGEETILVVGFRSTYNKPLLKKISKIVMYKEVMTHMIFGIGLPMVVEYFLENTFVDMIKNMRIFLSRLLCAFNLIRKSKCYSLYTSSDISQNTKLLLELVDA